LIPYINRSYKTNKTNNSIVGHSLGGLFVFYCLFKNDSLFTNYYALSPSLWVDHYSIYSFNNLTSGIETPKNLYFSSGGLEILNRIKGGTDKMEEFLKSEAYENLVFLYEVHKWKTHNSQVEYSLKYLLEQK
jgi:predicted alpha/beta superfamily hydrolase